MTGIFVVLFITIIVMIIMFYKSQKEFNNVDAELTKKLNDIEIQRVKEKIKVADNLLKELKKHDEE